MFSWLIPLEWNEPGGLTAQNILASPKETIKDILDAEAAYRASRFVSWASLDLINKIIEDGENFSHIEASASTYRVHFNKHYANNAYYVGFSTENVSNIVRTKAFVQFGFFGDSIGVNVIGRLE